MPKHSSVTRRFAALAAALLLAACQAETAPADFRKIEILNLEGCMDPKASNYKSYFVKANAQACKY